MNDLKQVGPRPPAALRWARLAFLMLTLAVAGSPEATAQSREDPPSPEAPADENDRIFKGRAYGHEAVFSPFTILLNRGYEIVQVGNHSRAIFDFDYGRASGAIADALVRPGAAIERVGGWGHFLRTEVLPIATGFDDAKWFPNYMEHLIGGGLTNRMLVDWYDMRGVPAPRVMAGVTSMAAAFLNEVMEHPDTDLGPASSVADLYLFDLGGVLLFNWDPLARFFVEDLGAADWSPMASLTLPDAHLHNNGMYIAYKIPLPFVDRARFLWRLGLGSQAGIAYRLDDEHSISVGLGADTSRRDLDPVTLEETIEIVRSMGIFYDRNNSLLASVMISERWEDLLAVNVYPGVLPGPLSDLGVWLTMARGGGTRLGIVHRQSLGLGIGIGR